MTRSILKLVVSAIMLASLVGLPARAAVVSYTSQAAFQADASNPLTLVNFDVDSDSNPIAAPSPGVLAGNNFTGFGINFAAGVVFGEPNLPFTGVSPPNIISNSGINTPTPARVDASFAAEVFEVGITNTGAQAVLSIFDASDTLLGSLVSDADPNADDFIGLISDTPIFRMEFDFVSGIGFGGDDLLFTQIVSPVPLPAAVWLFGSALLGLIGLSRRKKAA